MSAKDDLIESIIKYRMTQTMTRVAQAAFIASHYELYNAWIKNSGEPTMMKLLDESMKDILAQAPEVRKVVSEEEAKRADKFPEYLAKMTRGLINDLLITPEEAKEMLGRFDAGA